jgi:hypothetical protein
MNYIELENNIVINNDNINGELRENIIDTEQNIRNDRNCLFNECMIFTELILHIGFIIIIIYFIFR